MRLVFSSLRSSPLGRHLAAEKNRAQGRLEGLKNIMAAILLPVRPWIFNMPV
jgi:hypothetical protein